MQTHSGVVRHVAWDAVHVGPIAAVVYGEDIRTLVYPGARPMPGCRKLDMCGIRLSIQPALKIGAGEPLGRINPQGVSQ